MVKTTLSEAQINADLKTLEKIVFRLQKAGVKQSVLSHAWSTSIYKAYGVRKKTRTTKSDADLAEQKRLQEEAIAAEVERLHRHAPLTWDQIKNLKLPNGRRAGDCTIEEIFASYKVAHSALTRLAVQIPHGFKLDAIHIDPINAAKLFNGIRE